MKQVVSLIGLGAGQKIWMHPHEADSAIATGVAVWPEDFDAPKETKKQAESRVPFTIESTDTGMKLVGKWPKRAILPPKLLNSNMVQTFSSGTVRIEIGGDIAVYDAIEKPDSGELHINLREIVAENEPEDEDDSEKVLVVPDDWEKLHWRKRVKLARDISGMDISKADQADEVILEYVTRPVED